MKMTTQLEAKNAELTGKLRAATERLDLFFAEMRASPPKVGEPRRWSVRSSGWPWTHAVGDTAEKAVTNVLSEIHRTFKKGQGPFGEQPNMSLQATVTLEPEWAADLDEFFVSRDAGLQHILRWYYRRAAELKAEGEKGP
jgi:hypothetical protein